MSRFLIITRIYAAPEQVETSIMPGNGWGLVRFLAFNNQQQSLQDESISLSGKSPNATKNLFDSLKKECQSSNCVLIFNGNKLKSQDFLIKPFCEFLESLNATVICHPGENNYKKIFESFPIFLTMRKESRLGIYSGGQDARPLVEVIKKCAKAENQDQFQEGLEELALFCNEKIQQGFNDDFSSVKHDIEGLFSALRLKFQLVIEYHRSGDCTRAEELFESMRASFEENRIKARKLILQEPSSINWTQVQTLLESAAFDSQWSEWNKQFQSWLDQLEAVFNEIRGSLKND